MGYKQKEGPKGELTGVLDSVPPVRDNRPIRSTPSNATLQKIYNEMHSQGSSAWFGQGEEERKLILKMGKPWDMRIVEIGCGEGDLLNMISLKGASVWGIDYSQEVIKNAMIKYPKLKFSCLNYKDFHGFASRIVMQGVLEHLDDPFNELKWMMDNLLTEKGDVITSSPCFLNPRGLVWMTLDMLGAKMSQTDLHFLNPSQFSNFCYKNEYILTWDVCDFDWASGNKMIQDLEKRIPLALKDGMIPYDQKKFERFIQWLKQGTFSTLYGATAVYKIKK